MKRSRKGISILEIIVVVIVLGGVAAVAVPKLFEVVLMSNVNEAVQGISVIRKGMEECRLKTETYEGCDLFTSGNTNLPIENPGKAHGAKWRYWTADQSETSYHINACFIPHLCQRADIIYLYRKFPGQPTGFQSCIRANQDSRVKFRKLKPIGQCLGS